MLWDNVEVNEKSLSYRIQVFTFGKAPFVDTNYCPHFWFAVFCWLILPFTLIIKPIVLIVKKSIELIDRLIDYVDESYLRPSWEKQAIKMTDRQVWALWSLYSNIVNYPSLKEGACEVTCKGN